MPVWLLTVLKGLAISRIKDWLAANAFKWAAKILVKSTENQWDDGMYDVIEAIIDNEPTEEINDHMTKLVKLFDDKETGERIEFSPLGDGLISKDGGLYKWTEGGQVFKGGYAEYQKWISKK
tara:strand:- start:207 stop:572 length:366 start_codon:yes stop_codon:yes gene_type:complete